MSALDFDDFLRDPRLAPLCQSLALEALDGSEKLSCCDLLTRARIYRAAFLPSGCGVDETDPALLCGRILKGLERRSACASEGNEVTTPSFVASSADPSGLITDRRLRVQLQAQIKMTRDLLSQFSFSRQDNE